MKITTEIFEKGKDYTISKLFVDRIYCCYILEDVLGDGSKVFGKTAIPRGMYNVVVTMSTRFKRLLPLLENVPGFAGVRIHPGNTAADTEGCLLTGTELGKGSVLNSRAAFSKLFGKIQEAIARGEKITIELK